MRLSFGQAHDRTVAQVIVEHPLVTDVEVVGVDEGVRADDRRWRGRGAWGGGDSDRRYGN